MTNEPYEIAKAEEQLTQEWLETIALQLATEVADRRQAEKTRDLAQARSTADALEKQKLAAELAEANEVREGWLAQMRELEPLLPGWEPGTPILAAAKAELLSLQGRLIYAEGALKDSQFDANRLRRTELQVRKQFETLIVVRPADEWHEDFGPVLWWHFPVSEPPVVGYGAGMAETEADGEPTECREGIESGWLTHWSRIPVVYGDDRGPRLRAEDCHGVPNAC